MNDLIKNYGTFADLDECGKLYAKGICPFCWLDFQNDDEDHTQFFDEFSKWWEYIPFDEQVYNYQIMITPEELDNVQMYAADKYGGIENHEAWLNAIRVFVDTYMQGGKFVVYNDRNHFLADFDVLDDAIDYIEQNEPKNGLYRIECEILK